MRSALWPEWPPDGHLSEIHARFEDPGSTAFLAAERSDGKLSGFIELTLRSTAESCETHPVGYIEGWLVHFRKWLDRTHP
jgi:aminoglycoside 6'-N-acetyltransferase I